MPGHLGRDAILMRLVLRNVARYDELRRFWDINEVLRANEHLDIQDDIEWLQSEEMRRKMKTGNR